MVESTPTIYDVAELAHVSVATVSRAINDSSSVRPVTLERVVRAMEDLHFVPNAVARGLSIGKHGILGLVFTRMAGENDGLALEEASLLYTDIVIRGAEMRAAERGYSLLLSSFDENHPSGLSALMSLTGKVDGLIVMDRVASEEDAAVLANRIPLVLLAGRGDSPAAVTIRVDNELAMVNLAEHLVGDHGLTRVGFVNGAPESPDAQVRADSFRRAARLMGATLADEDFLQVSDWTSAGGEAAMRQRLASSTPLPQVFACANDQMAVGVIFALKAHGLRVPEDIAVTGFDDITLTRYLNPPLTTIRQSGAELGAAAVDTMVSMLSDVEVERTIILPTTLVVRASCGCRDDSDGSFPGLRIPSEVER